MKRSETPLPSAFGRTAVYARGAGGPERGGLNRLIEWNYAQVFGAAVAGGLLTIVGMVLILAVWVIA